MVRQFANNSGDEAGIAKFTLEALSFKDPFSTVAPKLEQAMVDNITWRKQVSNKEAVAFREQAVKAIEDLGASAIDLGFSL